MLNSRLLRQFIAVAEELHYGRAALRVGMAQSPLSQAIQRLEAFVGTPLFLRNKRAVSLTPAGRAFLEEAYQWLKFEQIAIERAQHASSGEIGQLSLGYIGSAGYGFMPDLIRQFRSRYSQVRLRVVEMTTKDQIERLQERALDLGMLRTPLPREGAMFETLLYKHDRLMAALPASHPLAGRKAVALRELARESFVSFSREKVPSAHAHLVSACAAAGFTPNIEQECSQVGSVMCLVAAGLSVALVPSNLASLMHPKVRYLPILDDGSHLVQEVSIAWRKDDNNPALASFLAVARELAGDEAVKPASAGA
jgi:DNA-binding transcriptional LysR family regulator